MAAFDLTRSVCKAICKDNYGHPIFRNSAERFGSKSSWSGGDEKSVEISLLSEYFFHLQELQDLGHFRRPLAKEHLFHKVFLVPSTSTGLRLDSTWNCTGPQPSVGALSTARDMPRRPYFSASMKSAQIEVTAKTPISAKIPMT